MSALPLIWCALAGLAVGGVGAWALGQIEKNLAILDRAGAILTEARELQYRAELTLAEATRHTSEADR
jgi:hypothetical protein